MSFIDRLKQEQIDLKTKVDKLHSFIDADYHGSDIGKVQAVLLNKQLSVMREYNSILEDRIADLTKNG